MSFVVIIVAQLLLQYWGPTEVMHRDTWFHQWWHRLQTVLSARSALLIAVGLPTLAVWLTCRGLDSVGYGIPLFLVKLLVLLYSLGRGDLRADLNAYLERWRRGDLEAAYRYARQLDSGQFMAQVDSPAALHGQVRRRLLYRGLERWFSVVFWFVLLGPAAGLAYRLLQRAAIERNRAAEGPALARDVLTLADWLPARLLGLSFALMGQFGETMAVWRRTLALAVSTETLLVEYQQAAQQVPIYHNWGTADVLRATEQELAGLIAMLARSVVLWITVLAIVQLLW